MPERRVAGQVPRFELLEWKERFGILAGITGRGEESLPFDLGLGGQAAPVGEVLARWRTFRASLPTFHAAVIARQVHGTTVLWHDAAAGLVLRDDADGHATATPGILLTVTVADCRSTPLPRMSATVPRQPAWSNAMVLWDGSMR